MALAELREHIGAVQIADEVVGEVGGDGQAEEAGDAEAAGGLGERRGGIDALDLHARRHDPPDLGVGEAERAEQHVGLAGFELTAFAAEVDGGAQLAERERGPRLAGAAHEPQPQARHGVQRRHDRQGQPHPPAQRMREQAHHHQVVVQRDRLGADFAEDDE